MSLIRFEVDLEGEVELNRALLGISKDCNDVSDAWEPIAKDFWATEEAIFNAENSFEGRDQWKALKPEYAEWKAMHFPGMPIMQRTQRLKRSLTGKGFYDDSSVFEKDKMSMEIGTNIPYARSHMYYFRFKNGYVRPPRPPISFSDAERKRWMRIFTQQVRKFINLNLAQNRPANE